MSHRDTHISKNATILEIMMWSCTNVGPLSCRASEPTQVCASLPTGVEDRPVSNTRSPCAHLAARGRGGVTCSLALWSATPASDSSASLVPLLTELTEKGVRGVRPLQTQDDGSVRCADGTPVQRRCGCSRRSLLFSLVVRRISSRTLHRTQQRYVHQRGLRSSTGLLDAPMPQEAR